MIHILTGAYRIWELPTGFSRVELDLGCGKGGFLLAMAGKDPASLYLGVDVMLGRLRRVQRKIERRSLTNVALLRVNAWDLVGHLLPDYCLHRAHILCPDPWPKARHRSKRLVTSEFLGRLAQKIAPGGVVHLSTDNANYLAAMRAAIAPLDAYHSYPDGIADISAIKTDFEREFEDQGLTVTHLAFAVKHEA